jgi:23S rRNA (adenine2030-N6)-methyltransferase
MLSYQHAYHAGNHADVLKHIVLLAIIQYMQDKPVPISYIDTHAGAGSYALHQAQAQTTQEAATGIRKLWALYRDINTNIINTNIINTDINLNTGINLKSKQSVNIPAKKALPELMTRYLDAIAQFNPVGQLLHYPGSPLLMLARLRTAEFIPDTLRVFERHPAERLLLEAHLMRNTPVQPTPITGQRISRVRPVLIQGEEGFSGLASLLPPPHRRALVLIDPSYEIKTDYRSVLDTLRNAMTKFPTGTYAVWYPMLKRIEAQQLIPRLKTLCNQHKGTQYLNVTLAITAPHPDSFGGLWGSGMFIINPPWTLAAALKVTMPVLKNALAQDNEARWTIEGT